MLKVLGIERHAFPEHRKEEPIRTPRGHKMADSHIGPDRHHAEDAIYMQTLQDVAKGLNRGLSLWMQQQGKRETLISSSSLRVRYASA